MEPDANILQLHDGLGSRLFHINYSSPLEARTTSLVTFAESSRSELNYFWEHPALSIGEQAKFPPT